MTIQYTTTPGLSELGGYAVSITDANGVPYPDPVGSAQTFYFTGNTTSGSPTITNYAPASGLQVGAAVSGVGIPTGATILSINTSASTFVISANATATATAVALTVVITAYLPQTRTFPVDTSFEPYRREAFRHRSIPGQREAIQITNIMGEGTVNTEGLWRREMREFQEGAGQQYLDHKEGDSASRFFSSKGVDVFSYPYQAKLLPDTYRMDTTSSPASNIMSVVANGYTVVVSGTTVTYYSGISTVGSAWTGATTMSFSGTAPATIYDIAASNSVVYLATNNGLWYVQVPAYGPATFNLFATGSYTMVAWANDQLIASNGANLYAFQPRSSTVAPLYGSPPVVSVVPISLTGVGNNGSIKVNLAAASNLFVVGQSLTIQNTQTLAQFTSISVSGATVTATCASGTYHGLQVGNTIAVVMGYSTGASITETVTVTATPSTTTFQWNSTKAPSATNFSGGTATATTSQYNGVWNVSTVSTNYLIVQQAGGTTPAASAYGSQTIGGSIGGSQVPDLLVTNPDPNWVWSDAVGGETQVYFSGYSSHYNGSKTNGCIYRSDLLGSSTTSSTNTQTITTSQVAQPWQLVSPVQALPMSPDEYPTCIQSYLNYIFIGTNRGIRMAQTLSIYDPTATATGDLKAGPLIPNILQPVSNPVTAIVGDGRFVWFAWSNYDSSSTGLGRLDLTTFIAGDPLAPVYASDLMVTGQGIINSLAWNPIKNVPTIAVASLGVYEPNGVNVNGAITVTSTQGKFVSQGSLTTSIFDYGIPDQKAPVYFEYGGVTPTGATLQANVICEPQESFAQTLTISSFTSPTIIGTATKEYNVGSSPKSSQFQVVMNLNAGSSNTTSPTLYRWTLKSFPNVVSGTNISVVLQLFSVNVVDGEEVYVDPYDNFYWLESLRQAQNLVTYTEGPLSTSTAIIESLDWIPHKRRDNYENGFEGDCVVTLKTLGPYTYTRPST